MARHIFNTLSLISALLLVGTVLLWAWSFGTDPRKDRLSFSDNFHVGFYDGRIAFFSDAHGPYHRGSEISLDRDIEISSYRALDDRFGGIFYRYFRLTDSTLLFTLSVSLLYPLFVLSVPPLVWAWRWWQAKTAAGSENAKGKS